MRIEGETFCGPMAARKPMQSSADRSDNESHQKITIQTHDDLKMVLGVGFEPTKANADRFTVCCV